MSKLALHWQIFWGMALGAAIGLTLNVTVGARRTVVPQDELPAGIAALEFRDTTNRIDIRVTRAGEEPQQWVVDATRQQPGSLASLIELEKQAPEAYAW